MSGNTYSLKTSNTSAFVKTFNTDPNNNTWVYKNISGHKVLEPSSKDRDVLIPKDLIVEGNIISPTIAGLLATINNLQIQIDSLQAQINNI